MMMKYIGNQIGTEERKDNNGGMVASNKFSSEVLYALGLCNICFMYFGPVQLLRGEGM